MTFKKGKNYTSNATLTMSWGAIAFRKGVSYRCCKGGNENTAMLEDEEGEAHAISGWACHFYDANAPANLNKNLPANWPASNTGTPIPISQPELADGWVNPAPKHPKAKSRWDFV